MDPHRHIQRHCRVILVASFSAVAFASGAFAAPPGAPVKVVNTPDAPVPVAVRTPNIFKRFVQLGQGQGWNRPFFEQFTVPDGKRIALEFVSGRACIAGGFYPEIFIGFNASSGASLAAYRFGSSERINGVGGLQCFAINHRVRAYLEPGALVTVSFNGTPLATSDYEITLDGEILDAQ